MSLVDYPVLESLLSELSRLQQVEMFAKVNGRAAGRTKVDWPGIDATFWLTEAQRRVATRLLEAWLRGPSAEVEEGPLLAAAGNGAGTLAEVFRGSAAWGLLILPGQQAGHYRLPDLPGEQP